MGFFESLNRTRQFSADILAVERLAKEIYQDLDSLILEIDRANGVVGHYEVQKFGNI